MSSVTQLPATFCRQRSDGGGAELIRRHANVAPNVKSHTPATGMDTMVFGVARCRLTVVGGDKVADFRAALVSPSQVLSVC